MPTNTPNVSLAKPLVNEKYDVDILNENFDKLDLAMAGAIEFPVVTAGAVTVTPTGNLSSTNVQTALAELDAEKASKTQEAWITPTLLNGFTQQGIYTVGYRKDSMGRVSLRGGLANSTTGAAFTLPIGYRPTTERLFVGYTATTAYGKIAISTNGNVLINSIATYIFLDEVIFDTV